MNISLELYKVFYYVAKNGNITRAANELNISQPAISKSIKTLEDQMNTSLFIRKRDGVLLTEAGSIFYKKIKNAMEIIDSAENDIESLINLDTGTIGIGASKTIIHEFLMPYIKEFHEKNPHIKIKIYTDSVSELVKKANQGIVDVIITNLPSNTPESFNVIKLTDLHDIFVANEDYSYLKNRKITLDELSDLPLLVLTKGTLNRNRLDDYLIENNATIKPEMEFSSNSLIKEFSEAGFGIGMLNKEHAIKSINEGKLFQVDVDIKLKEKYLGLLHSNENNRISTKEFINFITNKIDSNMKGCD